MLKINVNNKNDNEIWNIINNPLLFSNSNYDYLIKFFSKPSKYEFFIEIVKDYKQKIVDEWNQTHLLIHFYDFVHKYESNPNRFIQKDGKIIDKPNYLAFKIALQLVVENI